jgi:hypothetical protein
LGIVLIPRERTHVKKHINPLTTELSPLYLKAQSVFLDQLQTGQLLKKDCAPCSKQVTTIIAIVIIRFGAISS